jgi:hypothetical protein
VGVDEKMDPGLRITDSKRADTEMNEQSRNLIQDQQHAICASTHHHQEFITPLDGKCEKSTVSPQRH